MSDRSVQQPTSPPLPFDDDTNPSANLPRRSIPPTAFIAYTHDTLTHIQRARCLAEQLLSDGVKCDIDAFQVSPPEGWAKWSSQQIQYRDFCIVVCTETCARRIEGKEEPGTGKGMVWEGHAINQRLYESGQNNGIIPVVFDSSDIEHIPLVLRSATYYVIGKDPGADKGYIALHRALTDQPLVRRPRLGALRKHLPDLDVTDSRLMGLLGACPNPLPIPIIARALGHTTTETAALLTRVQPFGVARFEGDLVYVSDRSVDDIPSLVDAVGTPALSAILDTIESGGRSQASRKQVMNAVALARTVDIRTAHVEVSRTFRVIQSILKSLGDRLLVLQVARRSIEASKLKKPRDDERVKDEAVATICGISWVYQRTGRLPEALAEAQYSLTLGEGIGWDKNTAFCKKCLGRLKRMESDEAVDPSRQASLLEVSAALLTDAIDRFAVLGLELEMGDCYSLLARTYLQAKRHHDARRAVQEAAARLVEPESKDYLDLQMVKGDLMRHSSYRSAETIYSKVIEESDDSDAQRSEIVARAYLHRGRARRELHRGSEAVADFERAAAIWSELEDPAAETAYWEIERVAAWIDSDAKRELNRLAAGVRVRVARKVREGEATRANVRSRRAKVPKEYLRALIREAKEQFVKERPKW